MSKIFYKNDLLEIQKNRDPFLMMDEVQIINDNEVVGKKYFEKNFWVFEHHWPGDPNVPAVFQTETMTQISSIIILSKPEFINKTLLVVSSNNLKFKKKILPNQTLKINSKLISFKRGLANFKAKGYVDDIMCCTGEFLMVVQESLKN